MGRVQGTKGTGWVLGAMVFLGACDTTAGDNGVLRHEPDYAVEALTDELTQPQSCDDLLRLVRADARAKIEMNTQEYLRWYVLESGGDGWGSGGFAEDAAAPTAAGEDKSAPDDYSETNTQVEGVDEADIVKNMGTEIFVLSGNRLVELKSWPANELAKTREFFVEGQPQEMFVTDDRIVVFSTTSDPRGIEEPQDYGYCGWNYYGWGYTKVTVFDRKASATTPERELYLQGNYHTSRRHSDDVRMVLNQYGRFFGWDLPDVWSYLYPEGYDYEKPWNRWEAYDAILRWRAAALKEVATRELAEWLPSQFERVGAELRSIGPDCANFYLPAAGRADYGMTQVVGFDMAKKTSKVSMSS
ncbi:MAG: beta-propeller domain-containing protein, partial [Myxococcales bacterium]|nr:beta-propeller domain-containing protein [Myxococcales bacterium]